MNIPNALTIVRLLLIPGFVYYYFSPLDNGDRIAVMLFAAAGITDILDGFIARRYNLITRLGTVLDPLADKLMLFTVLASMTLIGGIPFWVIVVVVIKETLLILGAITLFNDYDMVVPANRYGKLSTIAFYIAVITAVFDMPYSRIMLYGFVMITATALTAYINSYVVIRRRQMEVIKK